ncbi:DUF4157 domain-containing protein [Reichenbachiella sp.]|uniref:eCIS core domain-containing protein n=1 Tax=Reichenbachiella sp. TaxID=2184521 RepID=UPI00329A0F1A
METATKTDTKTSNSKAAANLIQPKAQEQDKNGIEGEEAMEAVGVQAKLSIGRPGDKYEQEADAVADKVVSMPDQSPVRGKSQSGQVQQKTITTGITPWVQKQTADRTVQQTQSNGKEGPEKLQLLEEEDQEKQVAPKLQLMEDDRERLAPKLQLREDEETAITPKPIQTKRFSPESTSGSSLEDRLNKSKGGGSALPDDTRSFMESRIGADFSQVKVHTGSDAVQMNKELGAQAFTHGNNVYFNQGKYDPGSNSGKKLLAHELTHTVQQGSGKRNVQSKELIQRKTKKRRRRWLSTTKKNSAIRWTYNNYSKDSIRILQRLLDTTVDGFFGRNSAQAVADFQVLSGLFVDGKAGMKTINSLLPKIQRNNVHRFAFQLIGDYNKNEIDPTSIKSLRYNPILNKEYRTTFTRNGTKIVHMGPLAFHNAFSLLDAMKVIKNIVKWKRRPNVLDKNRFNNRLQNNSHQITNTIKDSPDQQQKIESEVLNISTVHDGKQELSSDRKKNYQLIVKLYESSEDENLMKLLILILKLDEIWKSKGTPEGMRRHWKKLSETKSHYYYFELDVKDNEQVVKLVKEGRTLIRDLKFSTETKIGLQSELTRRSPYFTQMTNKEYIFNVSGESKAWERTCNVTSLAMALNSLGKNKSDFKGSLDDLLKPAQYFDPNIGKSDLKKLRFPDFLQVVVYYYFDQSTIEADANKKQNRLGRDHEVFAKASEYLTYVSTLVGIAALFGAKKVEGNKTTYHHIESIGSRGGRDINREMSKLENKIKAESTPPQMHRKRLALAVKNNDEEKISDYYQYLIDNQKKPNGKDLASILRIIDSVEGRNGIDKLKLKQIAKKIAVTKSIKNKKDRRDLIRAIRHKNKKVLSLFKGKFRNTLLKNPRRLIKLLKQRIVLETQAKSEGMSWISFRNEVSNFIRPKMAEGQQFVIHRPSHYMFLTTLNEKEVVVNDPAVQGTLKKYSWSEAYEEGLFNYIISFR